MSEPNPAEIHKALTKGGGLQGLASMSPEKRKAIASAGGKAAHAKGTAHEFTTEEARAAGKKGGASISQDRAHMSAIGRLGGSVTGKRKQQKIQEGEVNVGN